MSAIAYLLETEGIQTTGISLVRENTEALRPPCFLWTAFPLGRPLGLPGEAAFQHRVIRAALDLLERAAGPVLADHPEDVPALVAQLAQALEVALTEVDLKALKYGLEDLKTCYQEALTAQPGPADPQAIAHLLWQETELGRAMRTLADRCEHHENGRLQAFARGIAPRSQMRG